MSQHILAWEQWNCPSAIEVSNHHEWSAYCDTSDHWSPWHVRLNNHIYNNARMSTVIKTYEEHPTDTTYTCWRFPHFGNDVDCAQIFLILIAWIMPHIGILKENVWKLQLRALCKQAWIDPSLYGLHMYVCVWYTSLLSAIHLLCSSSLHKSAPPQFGITLSYIYTYIFSCVC